MSTVASTNPESKSDAGSTAPTTPSTAPSTMAPSTTPSTTAPSTKASTTGSTVAGSTTGTGASSTGGTAPRSTGTAPASSTPAATTATANAPSATNDLKSWFDSRKSVLSEYLDKFKQTAPASTGHADASTTNENASFNGRIGEALTNLGDGVSRVGKAIIYHFDCTRKKGGTTVLEANGTKATITWGPSPDGENHFHLNTGPGPTANNTTTIQTTVPPDLSSFVSTPKEKVKRPSIPSSFKSFIETPGPQRTTAPDTPLRETWDFGWAAAKGHEKDGPLTQEDCDKYEVNGRAILDALDELRRSDTDSSTFQSHLPTFEMYDRACRMKTAQGQIPDTPIDKANYAASTLCNRGVPLCDDDKSTFEKTLYKHFKRNHDLPPTLPTTRDGLDPYRASGIMMRDDGVPHQVRMAMTQTGRYLSAMNNRKVLWEENLSTNPPKTWDEMTDLGWRITDWAHQHGRCAKEDGKGVDEGDVREYVLHMIQSGQEIPRELPQSIIDGAEARRNGANDKSFDNCRGPPPSIPPSSNGPAIASGDKPSNYWPDFKEKPLSETSSKAMSLYQKLRDEGKLSEAVQKFFGSFPKRV